MKQYIDKNFKRRRLSLLFAGLSLCASSSLFAQEEENQNLKVQDSVALQQELKGDKKWTARKTAVIGM
ncbi:hypothetical protein [Zunongwangia profunda]|uniref:hypothetical protein n=1 Tax=Zunongwangia profunda TaxID=398743 RepID=UPI001D180132|nr:hypothetical protein [Zunongwangia profunda]MCC4227927.1 hypothetical protein [Zunongwangia profunda]